MGLAASQARFLGITLRKANLEFKSTELAQQKLQLTDQMSQISQDYSNAINATKLTWVNEDCEGNYGLTYSLLMMPSAANDYNPFMVTTKSGAVVLNAKYQAAAQAAGISMAGGIPSAEGYKKFVKEMNNQGLVTDTTKTLLLAQQWHSTAGLGAIPKDKSTMSSQTLSDLIMNSEIGGATIDWLQVYREALGLDYDKKATNTNLDTSDSNNIDWASNDKANGTTTTIGLAKMFHIEGDRDIAGGGTAGENTYTVDSSTTNTAVKNLNNTLCTMTMFVNDVMQMDGRKIKSMTLADLLTDNVIIMTQGNKYVNATTINCNDYSKDTAIETLSIAGTGILDYVARLFGYGTLGKGLNIDSSTDEALQRAYDMTKKKFLNAKNAVNVGNKDNDSNPLENSAYVNSNNYNRIGVMQDRDDSYAALNLSNMVSAFLTYYDNALRGAESDYIVGRSNDNTQSSSGTRTYFVTDDPDYAYVTNVANALSNDEKINDFYSELYNSICEHGWRYDGNLDDYEYLESTIKDGRYSLMALNSDGYYYQSKYNDIEYIVEEEDRDAIARAEADFTRKKAEINNKEDIIDIKTKKLDAEIMELTTELNSVQNLISKSIEKTFAMFSN